MRVLALWAFVTATQVAIAGAQPQVVIVERGPGQSGRVLAEVLSRPHRLVEPDTARFVVGRTDRVATSLVVLGRTVAIDGQVDGDLVVVGGDLFVHPGARIHGRAIAIGGAVYPSTLALALNETRSFRDDTFVITRTGAGYELRYQSLYADATPAVTLPGIYGLRAPSYDRVNGASIAFGPAFSFARGRGVADLVATYRSDLGAVDPTLDVSMQLSPRLRLAASAGRGTFSNDQWIWSDYVNSISVLVAGIDTRNYYRADRASLSVHRLWETTMMQLRPFAGARGERSWAVGPALSEQSAPWSLRGRDDSIDGMLRPNPQVPKLDLVSAIAGADLTWESSGMRGTGRVLAERSLHLDGPTALFDDAFTQVTSDMSLAFPTFGEQQYEIQVHHVTTPAGSPPPQRYAYLGGAGTLVLHDLLAMGGDELLFVDQRYSIPLPRIRLGVLGAPTMQIRHRMGSAGLDGLPDLEQAVGVGLLVSILRVQFTIDPATGKSRVSVGLSFAR